MSSQHRVRFARVLQALVQGRSGHARELAAYFAAVMARQDEQRSFITGRSWPPADGDRHAWLEAFFADEPQWRARIQAWCTALNGPTR